MVSSGMGRLSRSESRQLTRERLLAAARECFSQAGYAGTSVDMIAEAAGFSKGALYSNFEGKEAIFLELLEQHMSDEVAISATFAPEDGAPDDAITRIARRYANDPTDLSWCLLSIEFALHATRSPAFAERRCELFARHHQSVAAIIRSIAKKAGAKVADPAQAAAVFIALRQGLALERSQARPAISVQEVERTLANWMRGLLRLPIIPQHQPAELEHRKSDRDIN